MRLKVIAALTTLAALMLGPSAQAVDPPNFDFYGAAIIPTLVGGTLTLRSVLTNNGVVPTPIPLDFTNNEYTLVVTGTLAVNGNPTSTYNPATIQIYEDLKFPLGTTAAYAAPGTFTDGTLILSGSFDGDLKRIRLSSTLGSFTGKVDFSGGTRLGDLPTPQDWPFGGAWSRSTSVTIPPGYDEIWDGKIDLSPVAVQPKAWSGVKELYHH